MATPIGQTEETVPLIDVQEKLRLLGVAEEGLKARRDTLNTHMDLIRRIRRYVLLGTELEEATQRMDIPVVVGDADRIIAILAGHEAILVPPEGVQVGGDLSRSRRDGRGRRIQSTRGRRPRRKTSSRSGRGARQRTTGAAGFLPPPILRKAFAEGRRPAQTLQQALENAFGPDWGSKKVAVIRPGGNPETRTLEDDILQGDSILKTQIKETVERCLKAAIQGDGSFPQDRPPSKALSNLASDLDLAQRQSEVLTTLADWGITVPRVQETSAA